MCPPPPRLLLTRLKGQEDQADGAPEDAGVGADAHVVHGPAPKQEQPRKRSEV
jgi:hypothetical protein